MSQSIGQKLAAARKRRDLTIEDVAHETRIHVNTLRHLEADDYSQFANFTYATSFLSMYGRHLGLDMTDYLREFRSTEYDGPEIHETHDAHANGSVNADIFAPVSTLQRYSSVFATVALFAVVCTIFGMYFLGRMHGFKEANQIASGKALSAASQAPVPEPSPPAAPAPATSPPPPPAPEPDRPVVAVESPALPAAPISPEPEPAPLILAQPAQPSGPVEVRRPAVVIEDAPTGVQEGPPAPQDN